MASNASVNGIYADRMTASNAIDVLQKAGYSPTDIASMASENQGSKDLAHEKETKAPEGAATGAVVGAVVVGAVAWFGSTHVGNIAASGSLIAAGPVLAAWAGAGFGGAL